MHSNKPPRRKARSTRLRPAGGGTAARQASSAPDFGFTRSELRTLRALKTPAGIQRFLDDLPYNLSFTARSPKKVLHDQTASCLEGGIFAPAAKIPPSRQEAVWSIGREQVR